jgi:hypothetical protein
LIRGETLGDVLADGKDVAVGVFEPGYFAAVGGGPDAEVLILGENSKSISPAKGNPRKI